MSRKGYDYFDSYFNKNDNLPVNPRYDNMRSKKARNIVRAEIMSYYSGKRYGNKKSAYDNMTTDILASYDARHSLGNYNKAKSLVDSGCFACYHSQQAKMLAKIFGKKIVDKMDGFKVHELYSRLIAQEYTAMSKTKKYGYLKVKK